MAELKLEQLPTGQLNKRNRTAMISLVISLIVFLACLILLLIFKPDLSGVSIPLLAPAVLAIKERRRIDRELKRRIDCK